MSKKQLGKNELKKSSIKEEKKLSKSSTSNVRQSRATFIMDGEILNLLRAVAYWERKQIKTVLHEALKAHFELKGSEYVKDALKNYMGKISE